MLKPFLPKWGRNNGIRMKTQLVTIFLSAVTAVAVISLQDIFFRDIPQALFEPIRKRIQSLVHGWTWRWRIPKGYEDRERMVRLKKGKKVNILGREYCVGGLTEYDSNGEKFFEFALERDGGRDKSSWRWVLFSGEGCTLWAFWEDRGFWAEFNIPSLPIPSPVPMPFIEEGLKEKETLSFSIPSKGGKKLDVDLQDVRRGSKTTNLFGGSPLMPAPYERESKGVTGSVKGASVRVRDEQRDLMISLYEYGDNEILDDIYVGIPLNPTEDLVFGSLN